MDFNYLPTAIKIAVSNLNYNKLTEIRLRSGQPVIVEYDGEYNYLGAFGLTENKNHALVCDNVAEILVRAIGSSVYEYTEQLKQGFITLENGVRIGIAGEYVTENSSINTIKNVTSLNVRIPHFIKGCSKRLFETILKQEIFSTLIFSKPGVGKTTFLRDIAYNLSAYKNVLVFDERNEISSATDTGFSFDLGERVDVVRGSNKLYSIINAIRALKPQVIVCDEFYGKNDLEFVKFAYDCNIPVIASTHICNTNIIKEMPFEYFVKLETIGGMPIIYDKNFNIVCHNSAFNSCWSNSIK